MNEYVFHQDPGHGWIQVPLVEIKRLNIKPSCFSYKNKVNAYLEEDCDAGLWINAKKAAGEPYSIIDNITNDYSFIRKLSNFR